MASLEKLKPKPSRSDLLYQNILLKHQRSADHIFAYLMLIQYGLAISWALINYPRSYVGSGSSLHPQVWIAIILGGVISIPNVALITFWHSKYQSRWSISICQAIMSCLLISISGGRSETHFHIFGSLAFIALYRDYRLLYPAVGIILGDHIVRGIYFPASLYGVTSGAEWRFVEHGAWLLLETAILTAACLKGIREIREIASQQVELEDARGAIERQVEERTAELQASKARTAAILENALDAIVTFTRDGEIVEFNPAAEQMFGCKKDDVLGTQWLDLILPLEQRPAYGEVLVQFLTTGKCEAGNARVEFTAHRRNLQPFPAELYITPVKVKGQQLLTAYARDLGEKKRLEAELSHSQKIQTVGQLATGIAHEINTPNQYIGDNLYFLKESFDGVNRAVGAMSEYIERLPASGDSRARLEEILREADLDFVKAEIPRAIEQALEGVERVATIVSAMKTFSHPGQLSQTHVNINKIAESTVEVTRNEWKYVASIDLQLDPELPAFLGYPSELGQVFLNMIINAVHAIQEKFGSEPGGKVIIKTQLAEDHIIVSIADNGAGIPAAAKAHIFEAFYTTKEVGIGTGQGLAISKSVIEERHGGHISVVSLEGKGTTFVIKLPISSAGREAA